MADLPKLSEIRDAVPADPPGPWVWHVTSDRRWSVVHNPFGHEVARLDDDDNAAFVARARGDVPALLAALDAVLALHRRSPDNWCVDCSDERGPEPWPCRTVLAVREHIDVEG